MVPNQDNEHEIRDEHEIRLRFICLFYAEPKSNGM